MSNPAGAVSETPIPPWIKEVTKFWANDQINDAEYLSAIQWLIDNNILKASYGSIQDEGDFYAVYIPSNNPNLKSLENELKELKFLEAYAEVSNLQLKLPHDVPIVFSECGTPNAYYDSDKKEIVLCYELIQYFQLVFSDLGYDTSDADMFALLASIFVTAHELGHALIDIYDLPTTGMEEDAVDQFASHIFSKTEHGIVVLKATANWFSFEGNRESISKRVPFWDEHSLNQQRFYNIACWIYGSSPEKYSSVVADDLLPKERAVKCPAEHEKMSKSWNTLLAPYLKD